MIYEGDVFGPKKEHCSDAQNANSLVKSSCNQNYSPEQDLHQRSQIRVKSDCFDWFSRGLSWILFNLIFVIWRCGLWVWLRHSIFACKQCHLMKLKGNLLLSRTQFRGQLLTRKNCEVHPASLLESWEIALTAHLRRPICFINKSQIELSTMLSNFLRLWAYKLWGYGYGTQHVPN